MVMWLEVSNGNAVEGDVGGVVVMLWCSGCVVV